MVYTEGCKCYNYHYMIDIESDTIALLAPEIKNLSIEEQVLAVQKLANITKRVLEEECRKGIRLRHEELVRRVAELAFVTVTDAGYGVSLSQGRGDFSIGLNDEVCVLVTTRN